MIISKAIETDLEEILALQKLCYKENADRINDINIPPLTQTLDDIIIEYKQNIILKVVADNKIIGSVRADLKNNKCYIGRLIVHPEYQNKGIGKLLMQEIEKENNYIRSFELFTGTKDQKNLYLYQKLGYRIFRTEYVNPNLTMVYLEKENNLNN